MSANLENSAVATGLEKVSFLQSQRRAMPKNVQTIIQLCSFPMLVRLCSKSFKLASTVCELRTSRCASWVLKRQRNQRSNCQHPLDHRKTKEIPEKNIYFCFIDYAEDFLWITKNCGKFLKRWEYQTTLPVSWETCMQIKKEQLEPDMK